MFFWESAPLTSSSAAPLQVVQRGTAAHRSGEVSDVQRAAQWSSGPGDKEPHWERPGTLRVRGGLIRKTAELLIELLVILKGQHVSENYIPVSISLLNSKNIHACFLPVVEPTGQCQVCSWSGSTLCCCSHWRASHHYWRCGRRHYRTKRQLLFLIFDTSYCLKKHVLSKHCSKLLCFSSF